MSLLSEIVIEPIKSKTYLRLLLIVYPLTFALITYSSLYLFIKIILIGGIILLFRFDWIKKGGFSPITKIQFIANEWVLEISNAPKEHYTQATLLIANVLFQLIQFKNAEKKKLIILFNDQVTKSQLRLLHLKITCK